MATPGTQLVFIKHVLYRLKKRYGIPATFYKRGIPTTEDIMSGTTAVNWDPYYVRRAILFPSLWQRKFDYDLAYIATNNNFTYGGLYDRNRRRLIVDARDLPPDVLWSQDDAVHTEGRDYIIKEVSEFERNRGWVFILEEKGDGEPPKTIYRDGSDTLTVTSIAIGIP